MGHLVDGFEGLLARAMYVFDDAVVFVDPPASVTAADAARLAITNLKGAHGPSVTGQGAIASGAKYYLKRKKFNHIEDFSKQFDRGFQDPRVTSILLAEQVPRTTRLPLDNVDSVTFTFRKYLLPPYISITLSRRSEKDSIVFRMRYRIPKAREAHQALQTVLGSRVGPLEQR